MGNIVFGIIAVALLEVAFLGYAAIERTENAVIGEVRAPLENDLELAIVDDLPEFFALHELAQLRRDASFAHAATYRSRAKIRSHPKVRRPEPVDNSPIAFVATTTIIRTGPGIPRGYTMVLVDYLPPPFTGKPKSAYPNDRPKVRPSHLESN